MDTWKNMHAYILYVFMCTHWGKGMGKNRDLWWPKSVLQKQTENITGTNCFSVAKNDLFFTLVPIFFPSVFTFFCFTCCKKSYWKKVPTNIFSNVLESYTED